MHMQNRICIHQVRYILIHTIIMRGIIMKGIKVTTKANTIWLDASHVSAMWQARVDLD